MITISLCLSDLPKDKITTSEKNGKKYINLVVDARKEKSQYGETHTLYVNQTKEEREAKTAKIYVGGGKEYVYDGKSSQPQQQIAQPKAVVMPEPSDEGNSQLPF
jgi:chaperonin GroEL (HSP60 family)